MRSSEQSVSSEQWKELERSKHRKRWRDYARMSYHTRPHIKYHKYKSTAPKRKHEFKLSLQKFEQIISQPCYYCGEKLEGQYNGIDREDNKLGYVEGNCLPCCKFCNRAKHDNSKEYFIKKCIMIANKWKDTNLESANSKLQLNVSKVNIKNVKTINYYFKPINENE